MTPSHIHKHSDDKHTEEQRPASAIRLKACQHVFPQDLLFALQYIFLQRFIGSEWGVTFLNPSRNLREKQRAAKAVKIWHSGLLVFIILTLMFGF